MKERQRVQPPQPQEKVKKIELKTAGSNKVRERYIALRQQGFDMNVMDAAWQQGYTKLAAVYTKKKTTGENVTAEEQEKLLMLESGLSAAMDEFETQQEIKKQVSRYESVDDVRRGIAHLYSQLLHEATGGKLDIRDQELDSALNAYLSRLPYSNPIEAGKFTEIVNGLARVEARVKEKERRIVDEARAILNNAKIFTLDDVRARLPAGKQSQATDYARRQLQKIKEGISVEKIDDTMRERLAYQQVRRETIQKIVSIREIYHALQGGVLNYLEHYVSEHIAPLMSIERSQRATVLNVGLIKLMRDGLLRKEDISTLQDKLHTMMQRAIGKVFYDFKPGNPPHNITQRVVRRKLTEAIESAVQKSKSRTLGNLLYSVKTWFIRGEWYQ